MIDLTLPANILDGFRIICPCDTIEEWAESVPDWQSVRDVAAKVHQQLCSAHRVSKLRRQPASKRDPIFENISLFNRDALTLLALRAAVKRGDVGGVLCVSTHWMVMFRGTGHMPKYADAIFHVLTELKSMHPKLRYGSVLTVPPQISLLILLQRGLPDELARKFEWKTPWLQGDGSFARTSELLAEGRRLRMNRISSPKIEHRSSTMPEDQTEAGNGSE